MASTMPGQTQKFGATRSEFDPVGSLLLIHRRLSDLATAIKRRAIKLGFRRKEG